MLLQKLQRARGEGRLPGLVRASVVRLASGQVDEAGAVGEVHHDDRRLGEPGPEARLQPRVRLARVPDDHGIAEPPHPHRVRDRGAVDVPVAQVAGAAEALLAGARIDVGPLLGELVERRQIAQGELDRGDRACGGPFVSLRSLRDRISPPVPERGAQRRRRPPRPDRQRRPGLDDAVERQLVARHGQRIECGEHGVPERAPVPVRHCHIAGVLLARGELARDAPCTNRHGASVAASTISRIAPT